ncbi:CpsD/CapB family tyrosine-protein kinase [Listeria booriae]|uniref:non-specific protein-tyrosine kinase n=1 Tax=Listeria booriae TaxID=1552123 RepID=A0A7X0YPS8_9LIST|nr:CpsD/CapB family tyrosine-protein kinase [Listeria booriae]MBC1797870.1 CpsD/CapB family tyrosine-protein kinase [Listeria booriae]MBC1898795.1 CpsD/CapB family tyrosine-protein kinase [Listeria booriae]MBC1911718.1 CpsD/CapB family tyrosine-protein kinase [Listeria booriae]MBC2098233.1 CpsD/CapB family tyrosine-protein kinase [Listeria booriae]MBC2118295.1 CpsD/CapB family tyrosine-protein kinase [Listeria booriae]
MRTKEMLNENLFFQEQMAHIRTTIELSEHQAIQAISVTSSLSSEGKSSIAIGMARSFAEAGKRVLLIDSDFRRPSVHKKLGLSNAVGFCDVLKEEYRLADCLKDIGIQGLAVLTSGLVEDAPGTLFDAARLKKFMLQVKQEYDLIIVDTPPVLLVPEVKTILNHSDATLLVVKYDEVRKEEVERTHRMLNQVSATCLGIVFNRVQVKVRDRYRYYY